MRGESANLNKRAWVLGAAFCFYSFSALLFTWPLAANIRNSVPHDLGDTLLTTWIHVWDYNAITHGKWLKFFDSNIFYPTPRSLALSENLISDQLLFAPSYALTSNAILSQNVVFLLSFALSGMAMFALCYYWTKSTAASLLAGFIFAFFPARFAHVSHIQLLSVYWAPVSLLFFDRYLRNRSWKDLVFFNLMAVLQIGASLYSGYFLILILIVYYVVFHYAHRTLPAKRDLATLFLITALAMPIVYPYFLIRRHIDVRRDLAEVRLLSADLGKSFLSVPRWNWLYGERLANFRARVAEEEKMLFPGLIVLSLILAAAVSRDALPRSAFLVYGCILAFTFVLSLGPFLVWFDETDNIALPYRIFYKFAPGFSSMRVPARIIFLGMISASLLAGLVVAALRWKRWIWTLLIIAGVFAEYRVKSFPVARVPETPAVYHWLASNPASGPVLELPIGDTYDECRYVYFSIFHFKPLVNGYSGYTPAGYQELVHTLAKPVSDETIRYLKRYGVRTVILHRDRMDVAAWDSLMRDGRTKRLARYGDDEALELN